MAGDWLKFEKATLDKPEVFAIAADTGLDPDAVLGKLLRVWSWFDTHTESGNALRVTSSLLDRIAGATGFTDAMVSVGWMHVTDTGVQQPGFDKHTGQSAKTRATTARRVAKSRSGNAGSNDATVTKNDTPALAREEKRREEVKDLKATGQHADLGAGESEQEPVKPERAVPRKAQAAVRFAEFWAAYPVKKGKADAEKKWRAKGCDEIADQIIEHVRMMEREDDQWKRGFVPHGSTYVNGEHWTDEPVKDKDQVHVTAAAPPPEKFGPAAALAPTESKLDNAIGYIRQQYANGVYGSGDEAKAKAMSLIDEAKKKYGGGDDQ